MDEEKGAGVTLYVCIYICVYISPHGGGDDKKPRKIPQTGDNPRTQGYPEDESLGIAKPQRQQRHNRQGAGRKSRSPPWVSMQSSSGLSVSGPVWLKAKSWGSLWSSCIQAAQQITDRESFPAEAAALFSIGITPQAKDRAVYWPPLLANSLSSQHC